MRTQLRYFQEDIIRWISIVCTILCFGFDFKISAWIFLAYTIIQSVYSSKLWLKMAIEEEKLITWEWFQDEVCNEGRCKFYDVLIRQCKNEFKNPCDLWQSLESPSEPIIITTADGK